MIQLIGYLQHFFLAYFILLHACYIFLMSLSVKAISDYIQSHSNTGLPNIYTGLEMPISILVPAHNEASTISQTIKALLQLNYSEYEIIVINDGSQDGTLNVLRENFGIEIFPEAYRRRLATKTIHGVYISKYHNQLRIIDKENGGKADALNAGVNAARYPLFCAVDADSILQRDSIARLAQPFLEDPTTVAAGGTVRVANGCRVDSGFLIEAGLPKSILALFQVAEYLRAFLFGRLGWSPLNALLIVSGAFGLFHKETVIEIGGYRTNTVGEDMELIVRLHRILREKKRRYRIVFVPDPVCWTEAPTDFKTLRSQRIRWYRGLTDSLFLNYQLMFMKNGGFVGWVAMPYMIFFEWIGPIIELTGLLFVTISVLTHTISVEVSIVFFTIAIGFGALLSIVAVFLEELSFHIYPKGRYVIYLLIVAILENFGYRQLNTYWRIVALYQWARGKNSTWGEMKRVGHGN